MSERRVRRGAEADSKRASYSYVQTAEPTGMRLLGVYLVLEFPVILNQTSAQQSGLQTCTSRNPGGLVFMFFQ